MKILFDMVSGIVKLVLSVLGFIFKPIGKALGLYREYNNHYKRDKKWLKNFNKQREKSLKDNDELW